VVKLKALDKIYRDFSFASAEGQFDGSKAEELLVKDTSALRPGCVKQPKTIPGTVMVRVRQPKPICTS